MVVDQMVEWCQIGFKSFDAIDTVGSRTINGAGLPEFKVFPGEKSIFPESDPDIEKLSGPGFADEFKDLI
jgi:hypothetical protein